MVVAPRALRDGSRSLRGDDGRRQVRALLERAAAHLGEALVGSVSEIFDAEAPFTPRGCPAQAWGVAEWLRAAIEEAGLAIATVMKEPRRERS